MKFKISLDADTQQQDAAARQVLHIERLLWSAALDRYVSRTAK